MEAEIFAPLGLRPAQMSCAVTDWENHARGHVARYSAGGIFMRFATKAQIWDHPAGRWARFQRLYMNGPAYGGVVANARGYARFLQDMLRERSTLLTERGKELFFSEQRDASGRVLPTTLGWHTGQLDGVMYYSKPGGGPGFSSNLRLYRDRGIATVFLANQARVSESEIQRFSDQLDRAFLE